MQTFFLNMYRTENGETWIDNSVEVVSATRHTYPTPGFLNHSISYTRPDGGKGNCWNNQGAVWFPEDKDGNRVEIPSQALQTQEALTVLF